MVHAPHCTRPGGRRQMAFAVAASIAAHTLGVIALLALRPSPLPPRSKPIEVVLRRLPLTLAGGDAREAPAAAARTSASAPASRRAAAPPRRRVASVSAPHQGTPEPQLPAAEGSAPAGSALDVASVSGAEDTGSTAGGDGDALEGPAPGSGQASDSGVDEAALLSGYLQQLTARIQRRHRYPLEARRARLEGLVEVLVEVDAGGRLVRAEVHRPSGHPTLDHAALSTVRSLAPFPRPPAELGRSARTFVIPLEYALER